MSRILMATRLRPERVEEYLAMHRSPHPTVVPMLERFGHNDYRLHMVDDLAIASFDYTGADVDADRRALRARPELADWMRRTNACQIALSPGTGAPVWLQLPQIFPVPKRSGR